MRRNTLALATLLLFALPGCKGSTTSSGGGKELNSPTLAAGGTFDHTFNSAGSFPYFCTIHGSCAGLKGTVTVVSAATTIAPTDHVLAISQTTGSGCFGLSAPATTIHVGETVHWTNASGAPHTVTSQ